MNEYKYSITTSVRMTLMIISYFQHFNHGTESAIARSVSNKNKMTINELYPYCHRPIIGCP